MKITDEQIERANYVNLPQFLMMHGFDLKKVGREYVWKEHDSLHIKDNASGERGQWFRFSENKGGDNISFLREYMNMSFADAVEALTGEHIDHTYTAPTRTYQPKPVQQTARELSLAEADNARRVFAYLCKTRGLDYDLISSLVRQGVISQEHKTGNVLFKYYDENGKNIGAEKVGTSTEHKFKGIATGSTGGYGFEIVRGSGENAFFFESAIDMLSYLQMHDKELTNCRLVSMMGVKPNIVLDTMRRHNISPENVFLCSDNDTAGNDFVQHLQEEYPEMKRIATPDTYKDWNDMLRRIPKITEQKKEEEQVKGTYKIYQLPNGEKYHGIRFESKEQLEKDEVQLNHEDYELVYEGEIDDFKGNATLEAIFTQFNTAHPADFSGHSLSVSDVIVISADGKESAYYCDSFGFVEMPEFFKEKELLQEKSAVHEITFLGNRNGFDAVKSAANYKSFGTIIADGDTLSVVMNDDADVSDVRRLVETAQEHGLYLNVPSAEMLESRFGADFMQESHKTSVADLEVGDIIMYDGARREVESISDMSISLKDLDAPDFGGILLGTSDVLAYDGWQEDMESKGFEILSKAEKTEPVVDAPEAKKVHQVITNAGFDGGIDDKMEYATVDEAIKAGREYLSDGYLGFSVFNKETKAIEHTEGDFPFSEAYNAEILKLNEIDEPEYKGYVTMVKVGDFFEMYGKNAEIGAEVLGLHLRDWNPHWYELVAEYYLTEPRPTLDQLGARYGVSRQAVSKSLHKAMPLLRRYADLHLKRLLNE